MNKKINEQEISTDVDTFNKIRGKLKPSDNVTINTKKSTSPSTTSTLPTTAVTEDAIEPEAVIKPQDDATIKYLSNVKDNKTGEISKPFTIGAKKYQMVRGITPSKEIVMAVFCHDDVNENGENIIHPVKHFEENIVKPFIKENGYNADNYNSDERDFHDKNNLEAQPPVATKEVKEDNFDYASAENDFHDKKKFKDYLDLVDLNGYKHFFVNIKTGKIIAKFKNTKEMATSGVKLGSDEDYMDIRALKRFRFGDYFKGKDEISEANDLPIKPDVQKAIDQMVLKIKPYINKINEPIEKIQFIVKLTVMLQLDNAKYPLLISSLKKASDSSFGGTNAPSNPSVTQQTTGLAETKVITKKDLIESLGKKKVIKTIKIKNIK